MDQQIDDDTPTSSQPSSPQQNQLITPLTFQIHPSSLQTYPSSFNLNSGSPNFYTQPIPTTLISPTAFGSSFSSMGSLSQNGQQPVSTIQKNSRTTKAKQGKAQSSSTRKATSNKVPKTDSKKKAKKQKTEETDDSISVSTRKAPVYWEEEKNEKGETAMSVLLNWITTYGNWTRYKDKTLVKSHTAEEIIDYLAEHGFYGRNAKNVEGKISELKKTFNSGLEWLNGTGQGVKNDIEAEREKNGWTDDNPEYLARKKSCY